MKSPISTVLVEGLIDKEWELNQMKDLACTSRTWSKDVKPCRHTKNLVDKLKIWSTNGRLMKGLVAR